MGKKRRNIRLALHDEIPGLWALRTRAVTCRCLTHYTKEEVASWSAFPIPPVYGDFISRGNALVAEEDGRLAGYAMLNEKNAEVDAVFVDPAYSGKGIGRELLRALETIAARKGLKHLHLSSSLNAVSFYEAAGFLPVLGDQYAYPDGIALKCIYMEKRLEKKD